MEYNTPREIGELKARCMILEARLAALMAFAAAVCKDHPSRDQLLTRWSCYIGPALHETGPGLGQDETNMAVSVPGWVEHQIDKPSGVL